MDQSNTKADLKAAMASLLAAAASADAQQWTDVRTHLGEVAEHCMRVIDQLDRHEAGEKEFASGESGKS